MRLSAQTAKTILFVCFIGPGPVIGLIPWLISGWRFQWVHPLVQIVGVLLFLAGFVPLAGLYLALCARRPWDAGSLL